LKGISSKYTLQAARLARICPITCALCSSKWPVGPPIAASIPAGSQSVAIMIQRNGLKKWLQGQIFQWLHGNLSKNATDDI